MVDDISTSFAVYAEVWFSWADDKVLTLINEDYERVESPEEYFLPIADVMRMKRFEKLGIMTSFKTLLVYANETQNMR